MTQVSIEVRNLVKKFGSFKALDGVDLKVNDGELPFDRTVKVSVTENGKSISVIRKVLPENSNFAIAQAATRPNTRLRPTEMAATTSVSLIADNASGSASAER